MKIGEILHQFQTGGGKFPRAAVEAAVAQREEIIPELLRILEETADRAEELAKDPDYQAHLYAMFLLAQFREPRAYPLIVRIASLPAKILDALLDTFMTQGLDRVLASICGGEMEGIKSIVESPEANEWARGGALGSFVPLTLAGELGRDETIAYFAQLLQGKLKREPSQVWNALITCCCDLGANELMGDIERAYAEELVDLEYTSLEEVEDAMAGFKDSRHTARLIEDAGAEMEHWGCLQLKPQV